MTNKKRSGSMDALKVFSIFLIILHHFALKTPWVINPDSTSTLPIALGFKPFIIETLLAGGKVGVNLFIMITGYFMIRSHAKVKSIITVWIESTLIAMVVFVVVDLFHIEGQTFSPTLLLQSLLPAVFARYWFITAYSLLFFTIPWLNEWFLQLTDTRRRQVLGWSFALMAGYAMVYYRHGMTFSYVLWFIFLYLSGAYLRLNRDRMLAIPTRKLWQLLGIIGIIGIGVNQLLLTLFTKPSFVLTKFLTNFGWSPTMFYVRDASPWAFAFAVPIFLLFMRGRLPAHRWLQYAARCAFAAYLLHDSAYLGSQYLWEHLVHAQRLSSGWAILGTGLVAAGLIYLAGVLLFTLLLPLRNGLLRLLTPWMTRLQAWFERVTP